MRTEPGTLGLDAVDESLVEALTTIERAAAAYSEAPLVLDDQEQALAEAAAVLRKVVE